MERGHDVIKRLFNEPSGVIEIEPGIDFSTVIERFHSDPGAHLMSQTNPCGLNETGRICEKLK